MSKARKQERSNIGKDAIKFLSMLIGALLDGRIDKKEGAILMERGARLVYEIADEFALEQELDEFLFAESKKRDPIDSDITADDEEDEDE